MRSYCVVQDSLELWTPRIAGLDHTCRSLALSFLIFQGCAVLCFVRIITFNFFLWAMAGDSRFSSFPQYLPFAVWDIIVAILIAMSGDLTVGCLWAPGHWAPSSHKCQQVLCYWAKPPGLTIALVHTSLMIILCACLYSPNWTGLFELVFVPLHVSPDQVCDLLISYSAFSDSWVLPVIVVLLSNPVYWDFGHFW